LTRWFSAGGPQVELSVFLAGVARVLEIDDPDLGELGP
jgi:hypothetical protein